MNCTLDSLKNNRLVLGSLVGVGLTALGAVAHRLGLFTLCTKALSAACGHVAAVVQRHRFASAALALASLGIICLLAVAVVVRSRKSEASSPLQPQDISSASTTSQSTQSSTANSQITAQARTNNLLANYTNVEALIDDFYFPSVFETRQEWNPIFGTIDAQIDNHKLKEMIEIVLDAYLEGEEIPFCEFFDPTYLTIKPEESNRAQSAQFQQPGALSIFEANLETQRMGTYRNLLETIIKYYHNEVGADILPGDSFSYRFEITIGSEKTVSIGYNNKLH